jgi:hypothetical protein
VAIGFKINEEKAAATRRQPLTADEQRQSDACTTEEELCLAVVAQLRQDHPKAALAAAVDLVNRIARTHDLTGGAWL